MYLCLLRCPQLIFYKQVTQQLPQSILRTCPVCLCSSEAGNGNSGLSKGVSLCCLPSVPARCGNRLKTHTRVSRYECRKSCFSTQCFSSRASSLYPTVFPSTGTAIALSWNAQMCRQGNQGDALFPGGRLQDTQPDAPGDTGIPLLAVPLATARQSQILWDFPSSKGMHCLVMGVNSPSELIQTLGPKEKGKRVSQRAWAVSIPEGFEDKAV